MVPEIGQFALILALLLALTQGVLPIVGAARGVPAWMALARPAAQGQFTFVAIAFGCLAWSFVNNDFSVLNVATNSNSQLPLHYRFAATWGSHEGSLLLWVLMLNVWTVAVTVFSRQLPEPMVARVLGVMGLISVGFILFMLLTSNPFERLLPPAADGRDLNPLLQDPGMVIHPPMLYMGYVGFSVAFAFAIAALLGGRLDATWARWSRPWTTLAWCFLTLGIMLGSWWAYYELGWGGWWFWDPVEKCIVHAVAGRHRADTFARGDRETRRLQELDRAARDLRVQPEPARHIFGSLGRADLGACVRDRPQARHFHTRISDAGDRRLARVVRLARAAHRARRQLRAGVARGDAAYQQRIARWRRPDRFCSARSIRCFSTH